MAENNEVLYDYDKDFYKGIGGELRYKAEGLFKKAKEKGISIERISIKTIKESGIDFPGIGQIELPAYIVKVRGKDISSGRVIVDGKQIDYYNRYQKYLIDKLWNRNELKFTLSEKEMFDIGKNLINDKEFGLEKTITGACDRVIRKLMGENDWLYPEEIRLLDEEFNNVQRAIEKEQAANAQETPRGERKATERQINYFKAKIRNYGLDPEDKNVIKAIADEAGFRNYSLEDLSTANMSKLIDSIGEIMPEIKNKLVQIEDTSL